METFVLSWMLMLASLTGAGNFPVDMFETTSHQFGTVVRGSKTEYEFVFTNKYMEDVIVESVRSSCQCTTPTLLTPGPIKTHEQGRIRIHINTDQFTGNKNATITVRFASPQRVEMQLHSYVYIRSDVSVNPGIVYFGSVDLAKKPLPGISVNVNSINPNWKILDVQSECKFIRVEKKEIQGFQGATYNLIVYLTENAPPGPFSQVLELVTNDNARSQRIPIRVEGRVKQTLSASPSPLSFSMVGQGKKAEKTLVIQGAEPFKILDITSEDRNISASIDHSKKKVQPIKLTYTGKNPGDFHGVITIQTDLEGGMDTSVHFSGKVIEAPKPVEKNTKTEEAANEKSNPDGKGAQEASKKKEETLNLAAETENEKANEIDFGTVDDDPQNEDDSVASAEKDEDSLDLLDLPEKEDDSSKKTEALPLVFGPGEEARETNDPTEEIASGSDGEMAEESNDDEADQPADNEMDQPADEEADQPADDEMDQPADEEADQPADGEKAGNAGNQAPANIEEVPEDPEKADSASTPKAKRKGRNLLKKK